MRKIDDLITSDLPRLRDIGDHTVEKCVTPELTHTMRVNKEAMLAVAFFKDGRRIVTASWNKPCKSRTWSLDQ
jgi:hypothetical protein